MSENEDRVLQIFGGFSEGKKKVSDVQIVSAEQMLFMTGGPDRAFIVQRWRSGAMRIAACNQDQRLIEPRKEGERAIFS